MTTKVKICGFNDVGTMSAALDARADYVGLNFYDKSPRFVSLQQAKELATMARGRAQIVALVVDAYDELLTRIAEVVRPDFIQTHGGETPERIAEIKKLTGAAVIKVIKVAGAEDVAMAKAFTSVASFMLFDTKAPPTLAQPLPGGNGLAFDWSLLSDVQGDFMLAGGLNADTVAEAIRVTSAPMVDVASGVESTPGVKDAGKIRKFIEAAKAAR